MRALALVGVVLSLLGCGGGGGLSPFVGNWLTVSVGKDGVGQVNCPGALMQGSEEITSCGPNDLVIFSEDGTFSALDSQSDTEVTGRWFVSGSTLTVTDLEFDGQPITGSLTIDFVMSGDQITTRNRDEPGQFVILIKQ